MTRKILTILIVVLLCACASKAKYQAALNTWLGSTENQLISQWGVPQQVYESGKSKYLVYSRSRTVYIPGSRGTQQTTFVGATAYTHTYGARDPVLYDADCVTTFEIINGKIYSYSFRGNDCMSY